MLDLDTLAPLVFALLLVAYIMYFFFLREGKRHKVDSFIVDTLTTSPENEYRKPVWTHSQRVSHADQDLKCIVSSVDGERYCVRDRARLQESVDLLAKVTTAIELFVRDLYDKYPRDPDVKRLFHGYDKEVVSEILPNSMYEAVTTNKGEEIEFCLLESKKSNEDLIDEHTLMFVALHEITHIMCEQEDHPPLFWKQFAFLLTEAKEMGYHEPRDYAKHPVQYCDRKITDSPFFNWQQYQKTYGDGKEDDEGDNMDTFVPKEE
jgi:hypothetical protein